MFIHKGRISLILGLKIVKNPLDKFVKLNENAIIECRIDDYNEEWDTVEWCKNDFCTLGRTIEQSDGRLRFNGLKKYFIVGDRKLGQWNLLIENVMESDVGQFKCTVTRRNDQFTFKFESTVANLVLMGQFMLNLRTNTNGVNDEKTS